MADAPNQNLVPGALLTRLPGRARPNSRALKEFEEYVADLRRRWLKPAIWPLFEPRAEKQYRWRVQLECACIIELYTHGKDDFPDARSFRDPITRHPLPVGELWCFDHQADQHVFHDIVEWIDNKIMEFPADPVEPEHGLDAETWARIRHAEPHSSAFWTVRLFCGHVHQHVIANVGWKPEDGPKLSTEKRAAEMLRGFEEMWAEDPDGYPREGPERDHRRRMLEIRWPRPEPEQECRACRYALAMSS